MGSPAHKGAVQCLWEIFGGTVNSKGYKVLDSHVGLIYGDSITPERAIAILEGLKTAGFSSDNIVFGIGSYTYQYVTRDTYGIAVKSTYGVVNGQPREIFKDPATDKGKMKKSLKGLVTVFRDSNGIIKCADQQVSINQPGDLLETVFLNSQIIKKQTLKEIRDVVKSNKVQP